MATLQYDFSIVGTRAIDRAFASIERRAVQHNLRMAKEFGGTRGTSGGRSGGGRAVDTAALENRRHLAAELSAERSAAREKVRLDKWRQDMRNRHWQEEARNRQRAEAAEARASARAMAERRRSSGALFGRIGDSARSTTRAIGATATGALAIGGGFMASAAVGQQMRETAMASNLANQAGDPSMKGDILKRSQNVRGFTGEESLSALTGFVDLTGDLQTALKLMDDLAETSLATGAEFSNMTALAGNLANNLENIEDPAKKAAAILGAIRGLGGQGRAGSVEVKHLAGLGGAFAAVAGGIGGDQEQAIRSAGVLVQTAKQKSGSPEEAVTAAQNFLDMLGTKSDDIEGMGIKDAFIKGEGGANVAVKDPRKLIADIFEKTGGDMGQITSLFGMRGQRVFKAFNQSYQDKGRKGVYEKFDKYAEAKLTTDDIKSGAASRMADPDIQFKEVMRDFNAQVGSELLPVLTKLIPEFAKLLPQVTTTARLFGKLIESLAENPILTIGRIIAAKVVLDIAAAHIGDRIRDTLMRGFGGGAPLPGGGGAGGTTVMGAPSGGGSKLGNGLAIATTVLIGADAGLAIGNAIAPYIWDGFHKAQADALNGAANKSADDYGKLREAGRVNKSGGLLTDEQRGMLSEQRKDLSGRVAVAEVREDRNPVFQGITDMFAEFTGMISKDELARRQSDTATLGQLKQDLARISEVETSNTDRLIDAIKTNNGPLLQFVNRPKQDPGSGG